MKEMMVVVPVDGDVDEAQHIAEKNRYYRCEGAEAGVLRHLHLQYHDRDDDGDHPIGESQQPLLFHGIVPPGPLRADRMRVSIADCAFATRYIAIETGGRLQGEERDVSGFAG